MRGDRIGWGDKEKRAEMVKKWKGVQERGTEKGRKKIQRKNRTGKALLQKLRKLVMRAQYVSKVALGIWGLQNTKSHLSVRTTVKEF